MASMPTEPDAFCQRVTELIRSLQPQVQVHRTGPRELLVDGRRLDLDNVYRMARSEPDRAREIVQSYLDQLFASDASNVLSMPFELIRSRIMPRIQPVSIFEHLDHRQVAHVPFVNGTVVVFVIDLPQMTVSITTDQAVRWGLDAEDMDAIARENLDQYTPNLEIQFIESKEGGRAAIVAEHDGYDAARLLMTDLYSRLAPRLGHDFYVATPARDMFVALSSDPQPFIERVHSKVEEDYTRLPYPISKEFFLVTLDGVAGRVDVDDLAA